MEEKERVREIMKDSFTIIIPCKKIDKDTTKCIDECMKQRVTKEIIVVTDQDCPGFPSLKRNWAMKKATGEYLAFIDSDAYPTQFWLENALYFLKKGYTAVCGAGILPPNSSILEQAADLVFKILPYSYRVTPEEQRVVAEFPTFNLIVRRDKAPIFKEYLTGEDTLFCREMEGDILYGPDVSVYHERRPLFKPYWKQIGTYGTHRGHLIRLALLGVISTFFVYGINFIKGFFKKKI